ncbi:MAG TPA: gephyrin-like molybdotransferase Glp [Anaerolineales bacterium]|nr:gephyrin-like molybdotransferase Glp [Anaerolineales bacterium]
MPEFLKLATPSAALGRWLETIPSPLASRIERIPTPLALGRVLAEAITAQEALPPFSRSTVDGYALRAEDTFGASASAPSYLQLAGEVPMGAAPVLAIGPGQAAVVHTGGAIPAGANAVVMLEDTQQVPGGEIEVFVALGIGRNVITAGEDVQPGERVLEPGLRLRPQEIGGLMALGVTEILVRPRVRLGIISTGDEVVPAEASPGPGQVRDVNTHTLSALALRWGAEPRAHGIIPDDLEALLRTARQALAQDDLVAITAGSSASTRDNTAEVVSRLGDPGVLVHGLAIRPGKPTILGVAGRTPIIGLPGNPVSALVIAGLMIPPAVRKLSGEMRPAVTATVRATLAADVPSEAGREDYIPVRLEATPAGWIADPVFGKSNLIFTLVRADGLIRIPAEATGLTRGSPIDVIPME